MIYINGKLLIIIGVILYSIITVLTMSIKYRKKRDIYILREIMKFCLAIYLLMIGAVTLFPLYLNFHVDAGKYIKSSINLIPFKSIIEDFKNIGLSYGGNKLFMIQLIVKNVGGNILLFMPLGFLLPLLWNKFNKFKNIIVLAFLLSLSIEILQFIENMFFVENIMRITDIDDLIWNVLGALFGYLIYKLIYATLNYNKRFKSLRNQLMGGT